MLLAGSLAVKVLVGAFRKKKTEGVQMGKEERKISRPAGNMGLCR